MWMVSVAATISFAVTRGGTIPEITIRYVSRYFVDAQTNRFSG